MSNEKVLAERLRELLPDCQVQLQRFEELGIDAQLELISRTDLLIGAHGAGMTHCLYLPPGSAVLELFPGFLQAFRFHFYNISHWRSLPYVRWINWRSSNPAEAVPVPVEKIARSAVKLFARTSKS